MNSLIKRGYQKIERIYHRSFSSGCVTLLYHRIADLKIDPLCLSVTPDNFYDQIKFLKKKFNLLKIDEFLQIKMSNKSKFLPKSFIITFDDGYADNFYNAIPILNALDADALFYICTGKINTSREFWWDELERICYEGSFFNITFFIENIEYKVCINNLQQRIEVYNTLYPIVKKLSPINKDFFLTILSECARINLHTGRSSHRVLTSHEINQMFLSHAAVIGSHTTSHPSLSRLSYNDQYDEIKKSKLFLENVIGQSIKHFSYPYGTKADYDINSINICKELDFKMVASNFEGKVYKKTSNLEIPRFLVRNWKTNKFHMQMQKYLNH